LCGWFQFQKRIQNLLENGFEKLEKEKEKEILFYSAFWPNSAQAPALASSARGPLALLSSARGPSSLPQLFALGRAAASPASR
jgi:hypothetical protein